MFVLYYHSIYLKVIGQHIPKLYNCTSNHLGQSPLIPFCFLGFKALVEAFRSSGMDVISCVNHGRIHLMLIKFVPIPSIGTGVGVHQLLSWFLVGLRLPNQKPTVQEMFVKDWCPPSITKDFPCASVLKHYFSIFSKVHQKASSRHRPVAGAGSLWPASLWVKHCNKGKACRLTWVKHYCQNLSLHLSTLARTGIKSAHHGISWMCLHRSEICIPIRTSSGSFRGSKVDDPSWIPRRRLGKTESEHSHKWISVNMTGSARVWLVALNSILEGQILLPPGVGCTP